MADKVARDILRVFGAFSEVRDMKRGLAAQFTLAIAVVVLIAIGLISIMSNVLINKEFEKYASEQREMQSQKIVSNLDWQYDSVTGEWDTSYVHGVGMSALYDGYVIRVKDSAGDVVWDAENHDMSLCGRIMDEISERMDKIRPNLHGGFVTMEYDLTQSGAIIGTVDIQAYGPYFFSENDSRFMTALNAVLLVIGLLSLAFSFACGRLLARRISRPIIKAAHIATQVSEGNFSIRFNGKTRVRELAELVAAVNNMAESLDRQESLRRQLTTDVSHELRTPLSAVSTHLEMMIDGVWEPTKERLQSCFDEIGRITGLVEEIEKLGQIEADNLSLDKSPTDLLELAGAAFHAFESEGAKKGIAMDVSGESSIVPADRDRMRQVLANLLSNAIKYTPQNGQVRITVEDTPQSGVLVIEDSGIGIHAEDIPLIFERFYRTDKSRNRGTGGAGIGLTIAKSIVEAHGGSIEVESKPGKGSRFVVILGKA
ncbi:MAG: HAMP domain-containing protein [Clostridiales Family XIII bacterium]|nr:HAMP domain-containing protein [Clostridiales Family XIII bacterium]